MPARSRLRHIPSGGEPGISVEPAAAAAAAAGAPERIPLRRIVLAAAVGATTLVAIDQALAPADDHMGSTQVVITWLRYRFPRGVPFAPTLVIVLHLMLCVLVVAMMAPIVARMKLRQAAGVGALVGALLYVLHYHALTPLMPWLIAGHNPLNFGSHVTFGAVVAVMLKSRLSLKGSRRAFVAPHS